MKKKLLLFARDPGGTNTIIAMEKKLRDKYNVILFGKDVALDKFKQVNLDARNIQEYVKKISYNNIVDFLKKLNPEIILTGTSIDDMTENYIWKAAEKLNIPAYAILDQWLNYGIRFSEYGINDLDKYECNKIQPYLPKKICVMDEYAKKEIEREGIPGDRIVVTGQPYFEWFKHWVEEVEDDELLRVKRMFGYENEKVIIFASEPICKTYGRNAGAWGYTEETIFRVFQESIDYVTRLTRKRVSVIIRPHPKEDMENWQKRTWDTEYITYYIDKEIENRLAIRMADLVVGMTSMFLIESALCGKKFLSIQIGLRKENNFILEKEGITKSIVTKEELKDKLLEFMEEKMETVLWNTSNHAASNIEHLMEECL